MKIISGNCMCISLAGALLVITSTFLGAQSKPIQDEAQVMNLMRLGSDAMHQGKTSDAEQYFRQVVAVAPQLADAHLRLGLTQLRENKPIDAEASLGKAIELNPKLLGAHICGNS